MGSILTAICRDCGFEKEICFGGGMLNFDTVCNVPAVNKKTWLEFGVYVIQENVNIFAVLIIDRASWKKKSG